MGVVVVIVPVGETRVAGPGGVVKAVNDIPELQGPLPTSFQVSIYQAQAPGASATDGVTEQVPVPEGQPASAAVYHWCTLPPTEESLTHK